MTTRMNTTTLLGRPSFRAAAISLFLLLTFAGHVVADSVTEIHVPALGTPCANGESLRDAILGITDATEIDSYLVTLAAGTYSLCGAVDDGLRMKPWVDLEGAGTALTFVNGPGATPPSTSGGVPEGTFRGASNMAIRDLTLTTDPPSVPGATYNIVLSNYDGASPTVERVKLESSGGTTNTGIRNLDGASPILRDVEITVTGGDWAYGLVNRYRSAPKLNRVTIRASDADLASYGVFTAGSTDSAIAGTPADLGAVVGRGVSRDLDIRATGGGRAYGIFNYEVFRIERTPQSTWAWIEDSQIHGDFKAIDVDGWHSMGSRVDLRIVDSVITSAGQAFGVIQVDMTGVVRSSVVSGGNILIANGTCVDVVDENGVLFPPTCFEP